MEIEHYNAIAKIVGGNLQGYTRLDALINSLTRYFETEDENFNSKDFRSACLNGDVMEEQPRMDTTPTKIEISPTIVENKANNWNPPTTASVRSEDKEYVEATARMHERNLLRVEKFKKRSK